MKKLITTVVMFILFVIVSYSQDTITLVTGELVKTKIVEIGQTEIKYKKFDNLNGPIYSIEKSNVTLIRYENGTTDHFIDSRTTLPKDKQLDISAGYFLGNKKLSNNEFKQVLSTNPKAFQEFKASKLNYILGCVIAFPSSALLGWTLGTKSTDAGAYVFGGLGIVSGFAFILNSNTLLLKSVKTYNAGQNTISYKVGLTADGLGLAIIF
jgi:hypothetical protein